jgi:surface protein
MRKILLQLINFTSDISDWNTSNVKNMDDMLNGVIS